MRDHGGGGVGVSSRNIWTISSFIPNSSINTRFRSSPRKPMLGDRPSAIVCDALSKSDVYDGVTLNEAGMKFVVEGTPGACLFMTRVEILARRSELLNARLQASGHMHRTECDVSCSSAGRTGPPRLDARS